MLAAGCAAPLFAQKQAAEFPETPLGNIAREWVAVINDGDEARLRSFIENCFSSAALKNQPPDSLLKLFRNLQKQGGGIEVQQITPELGEQPMTMVIRSKKGEHYAGVVIGLDAAEGKLAGIGVRKRENPNAIVWSEKLLPEAAMIDEIRRQVKKRAGSGDFSGVVLVGKDDRILLHEAFGDADREAGTKNTAGTRFHMASVGKLFTTAATATLVRQGKLSFDDTIAKLLPDYPNQEIARQITIHQLLTHTAGLGTFFQSPGFDPKARYRSAWEEIAVYKDEPLFFEPGAKWRYSNAGFSLLAAVIERVSGKSYLEYIRENVLKPLEMNDTDDYPPGAAVKNGAVLYQPIDEDPFGLESLRADRGILKSQPNGFGGGFTTAGDLFKFARGYRTGKLLGAALTEQVVTGKFEARKNWKWGYGITEAVINGETVRGHSGGGRANVDILWKSGYTVVVLVNVTPPAAGDLSAKIVEFLTRQESLRRLKKEKSG